MNFSLLPLPWVLAGLGVLAGLLFILQQLRARHREVAVVTTVFWKAALQEAPVKIFRGRFRHWWAYLLIFAICALIWLAFAGLQSKQQGSGAFRILIVDGSAAMAIGDRYSGAIQALRAELGGIPAERRQVLWAGNQVRTVLNPGEDAVLLDKRLENLKPQAAPGSVEPLLRQLAHSARAGKKTEVSVFGVAPVSKAVSALLPGSFKVEQISPESSMPDNAGITALGVADAQSGAWDKVDVFVQVQGSVSLQVQASSLRVDLDGSAVDAAALVPAVRGKNGGFLLSDLPARGGLLTVRLIRRDALAFDDTASLRLPDKPLLKVQLSPSLEAALHAVLAADPAVQLTDSNPVLVVRRKGETIGGTVPALEFVSSGRQQAAFLIVHPQGLDSEAVMNRAVDAIGLKQIDSMSLAETAGKPVEVTLAAGPQWRFSVWEELLSPQYNFTRSRAFPLFVANALRWLAGTRTGYPYAAAGKPLTAQTLAAADKVIDGRGTVIDPLGVPYVPDTAGSLHVQSGKPLSVSLLDRQTTVGAGPSALKSSRPGALSIVARADLLTGLLLLALLLLGAEWYFYQKGRMP